MENKIYFQILQKILKVIKIIKMLGKLSSKSEQKVLIIINQLLQIFMKILTIQFHKH